MKKTSLDRRQFIKTTTGLTVLGSFALDCKRKAEPDINAGSLPRWRGFNLLEKFIADVSNDPFKESGFEMIAGRWVRKLDRKMLEVIREF